jgi:hypothetical protein
MREGPVGMMVGGVVEFAANVTLSSVLSALLTQPSTGRRGIMNFLPRCVVSPLYKSCLSPLVQIVSRSHFVCCNDRP